jgi:hypothetical protein
MGFGYTKCSREHRHIPARPGQSLANRHRQKHQRQVPQRVAATEVIPLTPGMGRVKLKLKPSQSTGSESYGQMRCVFDCMGSKA